MSQNHVNWFYAEELPIPREIHKSNLRAMLAERSFRLTSAGRWFGPDWVKLARIFKWHDRPWKRLWAITEHERLRLRCILDAIIAELYVLDWSDLSWILRDCDHPVECMRENSFTRSLDPKGFWRVDKELDPELRHTVLTLSAFHDLKQAIASHGGNREAGIESFCNQNNGDGWMLPETLRLDDFGLGHDARGKEPQPVRSRLGDRFLPWQLEQSAEESWAECEKHARNILGEAGYAQLQAEMRGERPVEAECSVAPNKAGTLTLFGEMGSKPAKKSRKRT
jgi:hypothetical protein